MKRRAQLVVTCSMLVSAGCDALFGVDFGDARPLAHPSDGGSGGADEQGWTRLTLLNGDDGVPHADSDFVNDIWCASLDRCVVATEGDDFEAGNLYAATSREVTAILFDASSIDKSVAFTRLSPTPNGLTALINRSEPLLMASEDFTTPAAWGIVEAGDLGLFEGALNPQMWFQWNANGSVMGLRGAVIAALSPPGARTSWAPVWMPPSVPSNYLDLVLTDATICHSAPDIGRGPAGWVSDDLQQQIFPVGNGFDDDPDRPGACVSLDGGHSFRYAELPEGEVTQGGPRGLRCNDNEHCWAFGDGSANAPSYIYRSSGSLNAGLSWIRAMVPDGPERRLRNIAFAQDNLHGWAVGSEAPGRGLLLASSDGGVSWSDNLVADHPDFEGAELLSVFALDERHIWVGGAAGLLLSNDRGGR